MRLHSFAHVCGELFQLILLKLTGGWLAAINVQSLRHHFPKRFRQNRNRPPPTFVLRTDALLAEVGLDAAGVQDEVDRVLAASFVAPLKIGEDGVPEMFRRDRGEHLGGRLPIQANTTLSGESDMSGQVRVGMFFAVPCLLLTVR